MKKELPLPPRGMIGPRAVHLSKQLRNVHGQICSEQGLFRGQQEVLFQLVEKEGITIGELAKKLNVSTATASVSVKRMEKSGFLFKAPDENDARITRLYPTQKAKSAPEIIKGKMDSLESIITRDMSEDEILRLSDLLDLAINNLGNRGEKNA